MPDALPSSVAHTAGPLELRPGAGLSPERLRWLLLGIGLLIRLWFVAKGSYLVHPTAAHMERYGDGFSYVLSWENLWLHGTYTFDWLEPDAAFGRLPGYPFLYGLNYLIFGAARAVLALQFSQALLDTAAIGLVFSIARRLAPTTAWAGPVAAAIYCFYPFALFYVTIIGTECPGVFCTLLWAYVLLARRGGRYHAPLLGLLIAVSFYVREYLAIFVPLTALYWWLEISQRPGGGYALRPAGVWALRRPLLALSVVFGLLYLAWPVRNYLSFHRIMPLKPLTAGYALLNKDLTSYRRWALGWTDDPYTYIEQVAATGTAAYPPNIFSSPGERALAERGGRLAQTCGSSFWLIRTDTYAHQSQRYLDTTWMRTQTAYWNDCNDSVSAIFERLHQSYRRHHPVAYQLRVPVVNISKTVFYNNYLKQPKLSAFQLFWVISGFWRTGLLLLAFAMWVRWRQPGYVPLLGFGMFMYVLITFILRTVEIRYMIQADTLLIPVAAGPLAALLGRWLPRLPVEPVVTPPLVL